MQRYRDREFAAGRFAMARFEPLSRLENRFAGKVRGQPVQFPSFVDQSFHRHLPIYVRVCRSSACPLAGQKRAMRYAACG
jgi:hypothetical protein